MIEFIFILMDISVHFSGKTDIPKNKALLHNNYSPQICWLNFGGKTTAYWRKKDGKASGHGRHICTNLRPNNHNGKEKTCFRETRQ